MTDKVHLPFDEDVRILIMNQRIRGIYHTELHIVCSEGMIVDVDGTVSECAPDAEYIVNGNAFQGSTVIRFQGKNNGKLHRATCEKLPQKENRAVFDTKKEAVDAGYDDPCKLCKP